MRKLLSVVAGAALFAAPSIVNAASITPGSYSATIDVGQTVSVDKVITLDPGSAISKVDVFFLADNTGSMGGIIGSVQSSASTILTAIAGGNPAFAGIDVGFGVGRYFGDPVEGVAPGTAYQLQQPITTSQASVQTAINTWIASGGGDLPEANFFALQQAATDGAATTGGVSTGQDTGWRDGAGRIIVWFGDAPSHTATVSQAEAIAALTGNDVIVAAINTETAGNGIDSSGQASAITTATGGTLSNGITGGSDAATIDAILAAVESAISSVDLEFLADGDISGLDVSYVCTDALGCDGVLAGQSRAFQMIVAGLVPGTYNFNTIANGIAEALEVDSITVRGAEAIPAPGALLLFGTGLVGLFFGRRRQKRA
jgi:hypothetical protein